MQLRNKKLPAQNKSACLFKTQKLEAFGKESMVDANLETIQMPGDTMDIMAGYCLADNNEEKISFFNKRGFVSLAKLPERLESLYIHKLLLHVVRGDEKEAEAMIKNNPEVLFKSGTVMDYSGRTLLNVTPLTAAYGAEDVGMLEMMFKYLDEPNRHRAREHIKENFPEENEVKSYDFDPIVAAITANENVEAVLAQFRQDFTPGEIQKRKHFNMEILLAAYRAYIEHWDLWSYDQCSLFFRQVIGYLQRLLPACYAQAFCQRICNVAEGGKALRNRLTLASGVPFFPVNLKLKVELGFDFAVDESGWAAQCLNKMGWPLGAFETFVKQRQQYARAYLAPEGPSRDDRVLNNVESVFSHNP